MTAQARGPDPHAGDVPADAGRDVPAFLRGGGEMGAFMRRHDWAATPLGPARAWPQSLRTVARLLLNTRHPVFVFWGPTLACLYNDAYSASLGPERHPGALGRPGREVWGEIWDAIGPQIELVMTGRGATWHENQLLPITRHGRREDVYWTYSYSPIDDEESATGVGGVLVICNETTAQVLAGQQRADEAAARSAERDRLAQLFAEAPSFMALLSGPEHRFELANEAYHRLVGRRPVVGLTVAEALPDAVEQGYLDLLDTVFRSGEAYRSNSARYAVQAAPGAPVEERFVDFIFQPVRDAAGEVTGIFIEGSDTTDRTAAELALRDLNAALRHSEEEFRSLGENQPNLCWMARADGWIYWYNRRWYEYTGATPDDMRGWGWQSVHDPASLPAVVERWTDAIAAGAVFEMTFPLRGADGVFRPFLTRIVPVRDEAGAIIRWFGSNVDISEQQATAEALRVSEARFRAVQETSIDGFMVLESVREERHGQAGPNASIVDFRWLYANAAAERIVSKPRSWFLGRRLLDEMPGNREAGLFDAYVRVVETGEPWTSEFTYRHDGMDIYIRAVAAQAGDGFAISFADLSERRRAEEQVRESEARFRVLADSMPQMVWSTRADGYHDYYNARWYEFTGVAAGATDGEAWRRIFHPDDRDHAWGCWQRSLDTGAPYEVEYRLRRSDGAFRWILGRALPLRDAAGAIVRWVGTCTDIEDAKQAAEVMARSRTELERLVEERTAALLREVDERRKAEEALRQGEKLQAIGQLTGGIAHDFNNVLQVVTSGATLLGRPALTEERRRMILEGIANAAQSAKELTSRLLAFARKQSLKPEVFDLNSRLLGMSELLRHTLGSRLRVETELAADLWPAVADISQLEVAILNLAMNARDAMLAKGGTLRFLTCNSSLQGTSERAAGDYVCLAVQDSGVGMTPAVLARVFEPFFTTKGLGRGTGLGLAQVHGFSKQSGGDIAVESAPGVGTTITVHLPRATAAAIAAAASLPPRDAAIAHPLQDAAGRIVLVVEDNPEVATFAATMLEGLGYTTRRAGNAEEALALLEAGETADAVFSDVVMPGEMNGLQLASVLRQRYPELALVLASGYSEVEAEWSGRAVAELLGKPYRLDDLAAALERALAARQTTGPAAAG